MSYQTPKKEVFSRYNTAFVTSFIVIVFIALSLASFLYFENLVEHKQRELASLQRQGNLLNEKLEENVNAIIAMEKFAHYYLNEPHAYSANRPKLAQEGDRYYLDIPAHDVINRTKNISGNITGIGNIESFDKPLNQELAMANALTPAFITAQKSVGFARWYYYVSLKRFVNLYPWIGRHSWQYSDRMLNNVHINKIRAAKKGEIAWSSPYQDSAGTGLNTSLGIGLYRQQAFKGAIVIDISLAKMEQNLPDVDRPGLAYVLLNRDNKVLAYKSSTNSQISINTQWQEVMPAELASLSWQQFSQQPDTSVLGNWLVNKKTLSVNGWKLIKYQDYNRFRMPLMNRFILTFSLIIFGVLAFFILMYLMTRKTFIKPTKEFINHIEYCSKGDPGKVKPTPDWLHWFTLVEDIFSQNRSLLQQLKEKNAELDTRVAEKTHALTVSIEQHQRDYALLRSVMNAIPELILFNDDQGLIIGCNQAFENFVQHSEGAILGRKAGQLLPKGLEQALNDLYQAVSEPGQSHGQQRLVETLDNTFEVFCGQFHNDKGDRLGFINIIRDVTNQYAIQAALEQARDQAEQANQAKSQFLANMSHEIRTPINAIQGMMSLMANTGLNSFQHQYLNNAESASMSLLHLIDELLDLAKIESGNMPILKESCPLDMVVDRALKLNIALANQKKLELIIDIAAEVPYQVMTDEMRLIQVLNNLLNNAVKFTAQGQIKLLVETIAKSDTNVLVRFRVIDTGIGIEKDKQEHLFDVFRQADESMTRQYGGSGLGLAICQQIVNLLGGEIALSSEPGQGSEFSFVLPFSLAQGDTGKTLSHASVHICSLNISLTESIKRSIKGAGWQFCQCSSIGEIVNKVGDKEIVLLLDRDYLLSAAFKRDLANWPDLAKQVSLLGFCQPLMSGIPPETIVQLEQLDVPYVLLEMPLYRASLYQIMQGITGNNQRVFNTPVQPDKAKDEKKESLQGTRVLLVEDNLVNQLVAKELLVSMEARVVVAENGQIALQQLEDNDFDIVLMDIQMPVMDGLTATKLIREQEKHQHLPIVAMTAHAREEDKEKSLAAGMNFHIAKPVSAEKLLRTIKSML